MAKPQEYLIDPEAVSMGDGVPACPSDPSDTDFSHLLRSGTSSPPAATHFRRLALGAGVVGAVGLLGLLAVGTHQGAPGLRVGALIGEQELTLSCAANGQNCISSRCCMDSTSTCFAKDRAWAVCKAACTPGIDSSEAPELQTPWSCAVLRPASLCSAYGENCTRTKCCKDASAQCYYKDPGWAECRPSCIPGTIRENEPKKLQTPWSCVVATSGLVPTLADTTLALPTKKPEVSYSLSDKCAREYGNCTERKCCPGTGSTMMDCFKRDASWSECRESCPKDDSWECSKIVTIYGPTEAPKPSLQDMMDMLPKVVIPDSSKREGHAPSLYCFSLMLPWGNELSLVRTQLEKGVGIFSCDDWSVVSNESVLLSPGPPAVIRTDVMPGTLKCKFGGEYNTALNSEIFFRVWSKVRAIGRYQRHDWTIKMDPDAVLLPGRMRQHVASKNPSASLYLNNCFEGLHGPIEVVSNGGMEVFANGMDHCAQSLKNEWMSYGEDVWLRRCFGLLAVARVDDYDVLREKACKPFKDPIPCTYDAVAFHPLKTPSSYFACLSQALEVDEQQPQG